MDKNTDTTTTTTFYRALMYTVESAWPLRCGKSNIVMIAPFEELQTPEWERFPTVTEIIFNNLKESMKTRGISLTKYETWWKLELTAQ